MQSESHVIINRSYDSYISYDPKCWIMLSGIRIHDPGSIFIERNISGYAAQSCFEKISKVQCQPIKRKYGGWPIFQFWDLPSEKCFSELLCLDLNNIHNSKKVIFILKLTFHLLSDLYKSQMLQMQIKCTCLRVF